jgi:hypothetical protein
MAFTAYTFVVSRAEVSAWRWHLKEKFLLFRHTDVSKIGLTEAKVEGKDIPGVLLVRVLDSTPSLNAAHSKARRIRKATHNPRLPLQRTLHRLELTRVPAGQIKDVDIPLGAAHHHDRVVADVHRVHAVLHLHAHGGLLLAQVPELDRLVPGARGEHVVALVLEHAHGFDGLVVRGHLLGLARAAEVEHARCLVGAARDDLGASLNTSH